MQPFGLIFSPKWLCKAQIYLTGFSFWWQTKNQGISIRFLKRSFIHCNKSTFTWRHTTLILLGESKQRQLFSSWSMTPYQVYNPDCPSTDQEDQLWSKWKGGGKKETFFVSLHDRGLQLPSLNNIYFNVVRIQSKFIFSLIKNILLDSFDQDKVDSTGHFTWKSVLALPIWLTLGKEPP